MSSKKYIFLLFCCLLPASVTLAQEGLRLKHQLESLTGVTSPLRERSDNPADILSPNENSYLKMTLIRYSLYIRPNWGFYASLDFYPEATGNVDDSSFITALEDRYYITDKSVYDPVEDYPTFTAGLQYRFGKNHWYTRVRTGISLHDDSSGEVHYSLKGKDNNEVYSVSYTPDKQLYAGNRTNANLELGISLDYQFNRRIALTGEVSYRQSFTHSTAYMTWTDLYTNNVVEQNFWRSKKLKGEFCISFGMCLLIHKKKKRP